MGLRALPLFLVALLLSSCNEAERGSENEVLATVNGESLTTGDLLLALEAEARDASRALDDPAWFEVRKGQLLDALIERKLLEHASRTHGIDVTEEDVGRAFLRLRSEYPGDTLEDLLGQQRMTSADLRNRLRRRLLVERLFTKEVYSRIAVTDQEIADWLEKHPDALGQQPERVRASQIVVKTEAEAKALLTELQKGATFAELATQHSLSPDAKVGGDLGWFARGEMPPPFDEVCFNLSPGRLSEVVESAYGFHIFLVQERQRALKMDEGERMKEAEALIQREKSIEAQGEFVRSLRENARIEVNEKALVRVGGKR